MGFPSILTTLFFGSLATIASTTTQSVSASVSTDEAGCTQSTLSSGTMIADCLTQTTAVWVTSTSLGSSSLTTNIGTSVSPTGVSNSTSTSSAVGLTAFSTAVGDQTSLFPSTTFATPTLITISTAVSPMLSASTSIAGISSAQTLGSSSESMTTQMATFTTQSTILSSSEPVSTAQTSPTTASPSKSSSSLLTTQIPLSMTAVLTGLSNLEPSLNLTITSIINSIVSSINTASATLTSQVTHSEGSTSIMSSRSWTTSVSPVPNALSSTSAFITSGPITTTASATSSADITIFPLTSPFQNVTLSSLSATAYGSAMDTIVSSWSNSTSHTRTHPDHHTHASMNVTAKSTGGHTFHGTGISFVPHSQNMTATSLSLPSYGNATQTHVSSRPHWTGTSGNHTHTRSERSTTTIHSIEVVTHTKTVYATVSVTEPVSSSLYLSSTLASIPTSGVVTQISDGQIQGPVPTNFVTSPVSKPSAGQVLGPVENTSTLATLQIHPT